MTYSHQRVLAIAVAICLGMIGAVSLGNAETLGISPTVAAWLTVLAVGLGTLQGFLPNVRGRATDPEFLIDRIRELPKHERQLIASELADRAARDASPPPPPPPPSVSIDFDRVRRTEGHP